LVRHQDNGEQNAKSDTATLCILTRLPFGFAVDLDCDQYVTGESEDRFKPNRRRQMQSSIIITAALSASLLSGCAYDRGAPGGRATIGVGIADNYDGYYDGYYGPFNDGYWGDDGYFWYPDANRGWHRDENQHFRREAKAGFNHVHGTGVHREH
jgi:hypothetical protein